jgi:hypothetical protein
MTRAVTLFTRQWADIPLEELAARTAEALAFVRRADFELPSPTPLRYAS